MSANALNSSTPTVADLVVFGAGGHARSVADIATLADPARQLIFVDPNARPSETILGFPVCRTEPAEARDFFVAIGNNGLRREATLRAETAGLRLVTLVSPTALVSSESRIEPGALVAHGAHIGPLVVVSRGAIVNTQALLDHEVVLGEFAQVGPNTSVGGRTRIGSNVFVGIGAVLIDNISVCDDVVIGANATVIKDIKEPGTYVGTPARKVS